jgi:hypothetical protein
MMRKLTVTLVVMFFMLTLVISSGTAWTGSANLVASGSGSAAGGGTYDVTYFSSVKNKNGPDTATNVVVNGQIGGGTLAWVTTTKGTYTISGNTFTVTVGTLAPGEVVGINFGGTAPTSVPHGQTYCGGSISASATETDPNPGNNFAGMCVVIP